MRKVGWYAVSAMVVALILGGAILLAANLYVQSVTVQHRIRQALGATLQMPVSLRKTTVTPWDGFRIDGIVVKPQPDIPAPDPAPPDFLTAESFRVRFALLPLLHRRFVVNQVLLDHPRVAWAQDIEGRWQFPPQPRQATTGKAGHKPENTLEAAPAAASPPQISATQSPAPETPATLAASPAPRQPAAAEQFAVKVDMVKLRHGTLDFLDFNEHVLGRFEEVSVDGRFQDFDHASGAYYFDKAGLPQAGIMLTRFHGDFSYVRDGGMDLTNGHGELAGGNVSLAYHLRADEPRSPFNAECRIEGVSLIRLFEEAGSKMQPLEGQLEGNLSVNGFSDDASSRTASGHFQLLGARLKNFPILQAVGEALRISDLSHLQFKTAEMDCKLTGPTLALEPLVLISNDFQITVHGNYDTGRDQLDLHARLVIDQAISHQLPQFIESNFTPSGSEAPGSRYMDFTVTGPLAKPVTNLFDRALSGPMNGLFENLMAPKPKGPNKKQPKHNGADQPPQDSRPVNP